MKRILCLALAIISVLTLSACGKEYERADEYAEAFINALLARDEEKMSGYIHPEHIDTAMPNDVFYKTLEEQYLKVGYEMTELNVVGKAKISGMDDALRCTYVARINELFYTVELIILEDDGGYGIVSTIMMLNTELDYYYNESE